MPDAVSALLVVDVQSLTLPNLPASTSEPLVGQLRKLLGAYRSTAGLVAFAITTGTPRGATAVGAGGRRWPTAGLHIPDVLQPQEDEFVYERSAWSVFAQTTLREDLSARGVSRLVITGVATTLGIESTIRAAYDLGYDVVVPVDAVADPDQAAHELAISSRFPLMAQVTTTDECMPLRN